MFLLWRGLIGGLVGGPLFLLGIALVEKARVGHVPYGGALEILAIPVALVLGAMYGLAVGFALWMLARRDIFPRAIVRAIIGASVPFVVIATVNLIRSNQPTGLYPPTLIEAFANGLVYVTCFGALPGILAGAPKQINERESER